MASTFLTRTPSSAGNRKTFTISAWVKRGTISSANSQIISTGVYSSSQLFQTFFESDDTLYISDYTSGGSKSFQLSTNRKLRDINCWYHILFAVDTTQGTASNRVKVYINGVQETSFSEATYPSQNFDCAFNLNQLHTIANRNGTNFEFGGSMSYLASVDGTAELPTIFGETDTTTGQWKIKTSITPSVAWGTNGFLILKNGNSLTDESTNTNNFTLGGGTLTNTLDCPSNVFTTLNVLERLGSSITVSNGNTQFFNQASDWRTMISNLAFPNTGKFYAEMQVNEVSSAVQVGIMAQSSFTSHFQADLGTQGQYNSYAYLNTGQKRTNSSTTSYGDSFAGGIIGIAVDMDNKNIYFAKDGVWQNSGNPESGATGTGAAFTDLQNDKSYCFAVASQGSNPKVSWNFGNGTFGTTAVTSAGTAGSTPGTFEYDVPSGYEPLSTKGLNA